MVDREYSDWEYVSVAPSALEELLTYFRRQKTKLKHLKIILEKIFLFVITCPL